MKTILPFILSILLLSGLLPSCDKMDCNGKLDGTWQLTRWENRSDHRLLADNRSGIYYYVKLDLMRLRQVGERHSYLARFRHEGDSLFIGPVYMTPFDTIVPPDSLKYCGVAPDGKFRVEVLESSRMILSNPQSILTFRKY